MVTPNSKQPQQNQAPKFRPRRLLASRICFVGWAAILAISGTAWAGGYQGGYGISKLGAGSPRSYGGVLYYPPNYTGGYPTEPRTSLGGLRLGPYRSPERLGPAIGGYGSYGYGNSYYYTNRYYTGSATAYPLNLPNSNESYRSPSYGFDDPLRSSGSFRHYQD